MKRVGNKSAQLVRSASRRGKTANRFQFDITVESIHGTKPGFHYFVKWSRGVKVAQTKPIPATKESSTKAGLTINQKISLMVTLYREEGRKFDPKDAKLSLIALNPAKKQERTTAKMHFDLSSFAGVPSASTTKLLKLSDKVSIRAVIDSRFIKAGGGPGSAGASSALSGMTGVSGRSSDDDDDGEGEDFDDLALDDVPEPEVFSTSSAKSKKAPPVGKSPGNVPQPKVAIGEQVPPSPDFPAVAERQKEQQSPVPDSSPRRSMGAFSRLKRDKHAVNGNADDLSSSARAEDEAKIARLSQRNDELAAELEGAAQEKRRLSDTYKGQIASLKAQLEKASNESVSQREANDASLIELKSKNMELKQSVQQLQGEVEDVKKSRDDLNAKCMNLSTVEEKNRELSREVDRLTIAASESGQTDNEHMESVVQKRMEELRKEKEALEAKVTSHQSHAAKVRATYEQLSGMYSELREQNQMLQNELDETKETLEKRDRVAANGNEELLSELEEARRKVKDIEESKRCLQSDHDRLVAQVDTLQGRLDSANQRDEESKKKVDDLYEEIDELKGQRDMAMQRALSKGKSGTGSHSSSARSIGKGEEETRALQERYEREEGRMSERIKELEGQLSELREDIEYEKGEKMKAREERDKIRENARDLERKTSQVAKQSDAMHSLQRQVSAHVMREKDHEAMITELRAEVDRLENELDKARTVAVRPMASNSDDVGEVLQELVSTKLALAEAEDEKLNLQFSMKTLKRNEKSIQQRLAAHASRLEVKLGEANEELERLRKQQKFDDAREFNELGSDVDY